MRNIFVNSSSTSADDNDEKFVVPILDQIQIHMISVNLSPVSAVDSDEKNSSVRY